MLHMFKSTFLWNFIFGIISFIYIPVLCMAVIVGILGFVGAIFDNASSSSLAFLTFLFVGIAGIFGFIGFWMVHPKRKELNEGTLKHPKKIILFLTLGIASVFPFFLYVLPDAIDNLSFTVVNGKVDFGVSLNDVLAFIIIAGLPMLCGLYALYLCRLIYRNHKLTFLFADKARIIQE